MSVRIITRPDWPDIKDRIEALLLAGTPLPKIQYVIAKEFGVNRWSVMTAINQGYAPRSVAEFETEEPAPTVATSDRRPAGVSPFLGHLKTYRGHQCPICGNRDRFVGTDTCVEGHG